MNPDAILDFWFAGDRSSIQQRWFKRDDPFDSSIAAQFGAWLPAARDGACDAWAATPAGALALCILLDQFPRNLHRGSALAFEADAHARALARSAVLERRFDWALTPTERMFLYLPFEHGEAMEDQDLSVALFEGLRDEPLHRAPEGSIAYAWAHRAVIARFGRFPHRNAALGRASSPAEAAWLAAGGGF